MTMSGELESRISDCARYYVVERKIMLLIILID